MPYLSFSQKHIQELQCYNWPGNIRELQNVLERAMITARHGAVSFQYLLEQDGQPVAHQEKQPNTPLQQNLTEILTIEDLKQLEIDNLKRAVEHWGRENIW